VVPTLMVTALKLVAPVLVNVAVPARAKTVVAVDKKLPVLKVSVAPVIVKFELAMNDLAAPMVMLLKVTVPDPLFEKIVAPLKVVVLFPAANVPVPLTARLPVMV
jgi:hypothetical protein